MEFDAKVNVDPAELSDKQLAELAKEIAIAAGIRKLDLSDLFASLAVAKTAEVVIPEVEVPTPEAPVISAEGLMATFDTAYDTFVSQVTSANAERAKVKGREKDKPPQLETVPDDAIRADVEAILANESVLAELQAEADYFTKNPEVGSPEVGFDIVIVPEELTEADESAIANALQPKIPGGYTKPWERSSRYNDKRVPEVTGKGYRIVFAPKHYNVPSGTAAWQRGWIGTDNDHGIHVDGTELQTATDAEALAQISNLTATGALDEPGATRFHQTYFRRFDQTPVGGCVSYVCFYDDGRLDRDRSRVRYGYPTRALVVPKSLELSHSA